MKLYDSSKFVKANIKDIMKKIKKMAKAIGLGIAITICSGNFTNVMAELSEEFKHEYYVALDLQKINTNLNDISIDELVTDEGKEIYKQEIEKRDKINQTKEDIATREQNKIEVQKHLTELANTKGTPTIIQNGIIEQIDETIKIDLINLKIENNEISLPDNLDWKERIQLKNSIQLTTKDLEHLSSFNMSIPLYQADLSWLNYCTNLSELGIFIPQNNINLQNNFQAIEKLPNLKKLNLHISRQNQLNYYDLKFIPSLEELKITGDDDLDLKFLKYINAEKITIACSKNLIINNSIDFSLLENKNVTIELPPIIGPYNLAILDIDTLISKGIKFTNIDTEKLNQVLEIDKQLDNIVGTFKINENSSDQEKLDAILAYILETYEYDPVSSELQAIDKSKNKSDEYTHTLYKNGYLDACFNNHNKIVCGNYAAMVCALANRVGLNAQYVTNTPVDSTYRYHAFNKYQIDGKEYYLDATWLDYDNISSKDFIYKRKHHQLPNSPWYRIPEGTNLNELDYSGAHTLEGMELPDDMISSWVVNEDGTVIQKLQKDYSNLYQNQTDTIEEESIKTR